MEKEKRKTKQKAGIKQWIYFSIAALLTVLFSLWTGYYAALLFILIFLDIYITKFVPWGTWRNAKNPTLKYVLDWVDAIVFALIGVWFINTFFIQNYQIPTSSLERSLMVGDFLCVSKVSYGGRTPMTPLTLPLTHHTGPFGKSYLEKPQLEYKRLKGTGSINRYDVVVFNYPSGDTVALNKQDVDYYVLAKEAGGADRILANERDYGKVVYRPVDRRENYVKRCVGLPGETIELRHDSVFIDGEYKKGSDNEQQAYVVQTDGTMLSEKLLNNLGISDADKSKMGANDMSNVDSVALTDLGFKYENQTGGMLYQEVNMTKAMAEKLASSSFVRKVMKRSTYYNRAGELEGKKFYQPYAIYPISNNTKAEHGAYPKTWIPKKGETIYFDQDVDTKYHTYVRCIKNYELNDVDYRDGKVYINGQVADSYTFKFDYFFMMGDNRDYSADSRSWGFVPEDHIVGKPLFVWLSLNPDKGWFDGKIRWNRLFSSGNPE